MIAACLTRDDIAPFYYSYHFAINYLTYVLSKVVCIYNESPQQYSTLSYIISAMYVLQRLQSIVLQCIIYIYILYIVRCDIKTAMFTTSRNVCIKHEIVSWQILIFEFTLKLKVIFGNFRNQFCGGNRFSIYYKR